MQEPKTENGRRERDGRNVWFQCIIKMANKQTESIVFFYDMSRSSSISVNVEFV